MLIAAVDGAIDFSQARLHDHRWWQYCRLILKGVRDARRLEVKKASFAHHRSLVASASISDESFGRLQQRCTRDYYDLYGALEPWLNISSANFEQVQAQQDKNEYIATFGVDPSDPEFQKEEAKQLAAWKEARELAFQEAQAPFNLSESQYQAAMQKQIQRMEELQRKGRRRT